MKKTIVYTFVALVLGLSAWFYLAAEPGPDATATMQNKDNAMAEQGYIGMAPAGGQNTTNPVNGTTAATPPDAQRELVYTDDYPCDFDHFVGQMVSDLPLDELERPYRVLETGSMYTMDYVPDRINIFTDETGEVVRVKCG